MMAGPARMVESVRFSAVVRCKEDVALARDANGNGGGETGRGYGQDVETADGGEEVGGWKGDFGGEGDGDSDGDREGRSAR